MKKTLVLLLTVVVAALFWSQQSREQNRLDLENRWLSTLTNDLGSRIAISEDQLMKNRDRPGRLKQQLGALQKAFKEGQTRQPVETATPLPDPERLGGWPEETNYLYLSKDHLANVGYKLLAGDRLTEEAALLMGMSSEEQESVNTAFSHLLGRFGQLEIESMEAIELPETWRVSDLVEVEFSLSYRIPDIQNSMEEERQRFSLQMEQVLGPSRALLLQEATDTYLRQHVDDLGSGERTVGFFWEPEGDEGHALWYGISGERYGPGSFNRISEDYDPDSQMAYYARLFGVTLPGQ
jgi:hypothetical protein